MSAYIIFKAILYDWLGYSLPRIAHIMGGGFGAKPGTKLSLASPFYSSSQFRRANAT